MIKLRDEIYKKALKKISKNNINIYQIKIEAKIILDNSQYYHQIENIDEYFFNIYYIKAGIETKIGEYIVACFKSKNDKNEKNNLMKLGNKYSGDSLWFIKLFINKRNYLNKNFNGDLSYIARMYIKPEYRNKGIGLYSFYYVYNFLKNKSNIIGVLPIPHEKNGQAEIKKNNDSYSSELSKMENLLKQFNFKQHIDDKEYWYKKYNK